MKKTISILAIGLILIILIIVIAVGLYLGPIVKIGIEQVGSKIVKVLIKVDSVDVSLFTGSAKIAGLQVDNPQGYQSPYVFKVNAMAVALDPLSVTSSKIIVHSIKVDSPDITFEGGLGGNNISTILANVNNLIPKSDNKPQPKIEVDDILLTGAKVHVNLQGLLNKDLTLTLPDIHLTDLGKDSNGITPAELTKIVLSTINKDTLNAVAQSASDLKINLKDISKEFKGNAGGAVKSITTQLDGFFKK